MSVKHAGYTAGYVVARKTIDPINGFEWTDNVTPLTTYGDAEEFAEWRGEGYAVYAMVLADMDEHFMSMVYGNRTTQVVGSSDE